MLLKEWDSTSTVDSVAMTLFAFTYDGVMIMVKQRDVLNYPGIRALEATIKELEKAHGTWKVAWGEINRLQRIPGWQIDLRGHGDFRDDKPSLPIAGARPARHRFQFLRPAPGWTETTLWRCRFIVCWRSGIECSAPRQDGAAVRPIG